MEFKNIRSYREGNRLIIRSFPLIGAAAILNYSDSTGSEDKLFRYTLDSANFTEWKPLTLQALQNIEREDKDWLELEISVATHIDFYVDMVIGVEIFSNFSSLFQTAVYDKTIFKHFFDINYQEVTGWAANVLEKLHKEKIISKFLSRINLENSTEDFTLLWRSICQYFSYYVSYIRTICNFHKHPELLKEYLEQRGLIISKKNTLNEMFSMMSSYYKQIYYRGTYAIVSNSSSVKGELLRLVEWEENDTTFLFEQNFRSLRIFGRDETKNSLFIEGQSTLPFPTDDTLDYIIGFTVEHATNLTIKVEGINENGQFYSLKSSKNGQDREFAHNGAIENKKQEVKVILYNSLVNTFSSRNTLNINLGNNLVLKPGTLGVRITISSNGDISDEYFGAFNLINKFKYLHSHSKIAFTYKNKSNYSDDYIYRFLREFLTSYNYIIDPQEKDANVTRLMIDDSIPEVEEQRLGWRGVDPICDYEATEVSTIWVGYDPYCETQVYSAPTISNISLELNNRTDAVFNSQFFRDHFSSSVGKTLEKVYLRGPGVNKIKFNNQPYIQSSPVTIVDLDSGKLTYSAPNQDGGFINDTIQWNAQDSFGGVSSSWRTLAIKNKVVGADIVVNLDYNSLAAVNSSYNQKALLLAMIQHPGFPVQSNQKIRITGLTNKGTLYTGNYGRAAILGDEFSYYDLTSSKFLIFLEGLVESQYTGNYTTTFKYVVYNTYDNINPVSSEITVTINATDIPISQSVIYTTDKDSDITSGTCMYKLHVEGMPFVGFANVVGTKGSSVKISRVNVEPFGNDLIIPTGTPVGSNVYNSAAVTIPIGVYNCSIYLTGAPVTMNDDVVLDGAISYGYDNDYYNGIARAEAHLYIPSNNGPQQSET